MRCLHRSWLPIGSAGTAYLDGYRLYRFLSSGRQLRYDPQNIQSVRLSVQSSELAPLHQQGSVASPPLGPGGTHSVAGEGVVGPNSDERTDTLVPLLYDRKEMNPSWSLVTLKRFPNYQYVALCVCQLMKVECRGRAEGSRVGVLYICLCETCSVLLVNNSIKIWCTIPRTIFLCLSSILFRYDTGSIERYTV